MTIPKPPKPLKPLNPKHLNSKPLNPLSPKTHSHRHLVAPECDGACEGPGFPRLVLLDFFQLGV